MQRSQALEVIERESSGFAALLRPEALTVGVPSCPGWTVADLARHFGGVQRWAGDAVLLGPGAEPPDEDAVAPAEPEALAAWFADGTALLVDTLVAADPDRPCWSFADPRTVRFWLRRQAHEAAMHRWDTAAALGLPNAFEHDFAHDGIEEVLEMFLPRQLRLGRLSPLPSSIALECDCGRVDAVGDGAPGATVHAGADMLLLLLWRRIALPTCRGVVTGDRATAERLLALPLTP